MNIEILIEYVKICKENNMEPNWYGLIKYRSEVC